MRGITNLALFIIISILALLFTLGIAIIPIGLMLAYMLFGAEARAENALARVGTTQMQGEKLIAAAIQKRVFALLSRRIVIAITSSRIITIRRGLLGGFTMQDVQWKDLSDATLEENVLPSLCGSNISFKHLAKNTGHIVVNGIESEAASTIYTTAQFEEQAWEEKRRVREIEEVRAASGGITLHTGQAAPVESAKPSGGNRILLEITKAKELFDAGAISDSEFQEMKSKILAG